MTKLTRRQSLGLLAAATIPPTAAVAVASVKSPEQPVDPMVRVFTALGELKGAMRDAFGAWPEEAGNLDHWSGSVIVLSVLNPEQRSAGTKVKWFLDDDGPLFAEDRV